MNIHALIMLLRASASVRIPGCLQETVQLLPEAPLAATLLAAAAMFSAR